MVPTVNESDVSVSGTIWPSLVMLALFGTVAVALTSISHPFLSVMKICVSVDDEFAWTKYSALKTWSL